MFPGVIERSTMRGVRIKDNKLNKFLFLFYFIFLLLSILESRVMVDGT